MQDTLYFTGLLKVILSTVIFWLIIGIFIFSKPAKIVLGKVLNTKVTELTVFEFMIAAFFVVCAYRVVFN